MYQFFDKKGRPLSSDQIINACNGRQDYYVVGANIGGVELLGKRDSQEDRMIFCDLDQRACAQFSHLSEEQKIYLFQSVFTHMQQHIVSNLKDSDIRQQGATAMVTWLEVGKQNCWSASLGDGQVFLVHLSSTGILKAVQALNQRHNPDEPRELLRLTDYATHLGKALDELAPICSGFKRRLAGVLAVSRAFGDTAYEPYGMIHVPEIQKTHYKVLAGEKVFIINACDGLTECDAITNNMIGEYISLHHHTQNCGLMAHGLAEWAIQEGSQDNISVQIAELTALEQASVCMLAVFDGHGGPRVAAHLKAHFENIFLSCLTSLHFFK
ncbi:MAG: PP2C family serine/threonine-protein phosphatase [Candidatus Berkiella sp.]